MKKTIFLCLALLQAACLPMPVENEISACPAEGLQSVAFFDGRPPGGVPIAPEGGTWDLSKAKGTLFLTCRYADGFERLQQMPGMVKSCTLTPGHSLSCRSMI
jgi:hypothetical protein